MTVVHALVIPKRSYTLPERIIAHRAQISNRRPLACRSYKRIRCVPAKSLPKQRRHSGTAWLLEELYRWFVQGENINRQFVISRRPMHR